jgi:hypothetical protein
METSETAPVTESSEATTETAETTEAPKETAEAAPEENKPQSYDEKINDMLKRHEDREKGKEDETLREGESWNKIYENQSPEVQRAMKSLRKDYTQKTMDLAAKRKELEAEQEKTRKMQKSLYESEAYKGLQQIAEQEGEEFDPFNPESFKKYIEKQVAVRLKQVMEPMYKEQQRDQARSKLNRFMDDHAELKTDEGFKKEVATLLKADESLTLENAYWVVKGKRLQHQHKATTQEREKKKRAARAVGLQIGNGKRKGTTLPSDMTSMKAADIYDYLLSQQK